jgi:hypothetical protein
LEDSYLIKCEKCGIYKENPSNYLFYEINFYKLFEEFFIEPLGDLLKEQFEIIDKKDFLYSFFTIDDINFTILFIPYNLSKRDILDKLYTLYSEILTDYLVIVTISENIGKILELGSWIIFGRNLVAIPISTYDITELKNYIDNFLGIAILEKKILSKIKDINLEKLIVSINTNPKYLQLLLLNLRTLKQVGLKILNYKEIWILLEDLVSITFRLLYSSDISFGGHKNIGKRVPDNIFIITKPISDGKIPYIIGVVDCKSSEELDLDNKETREKYINYLRKLREISVISDRKKALIFVALGDRAKYIESYDNIEKNLRDKEYMVILPIDSLLTPIDIYLNVIIRGELQMREYLENLEAFLTQLFDDEFLRSLKRNKDYTSFFNEEILTRDKLFYITPNLIIKELENRLDFFEPAGYI